MSKYELVYLVAPETPEDRQAEIVDRLKGYVQQMGGTLESLDLWEKRRLAYPVHKCNEAFFYILRFEGDGKLVGELQRRLRVADEVIRYITIHKDEEQMVADKKKAYYQKKREGLEKRKKKQAPPSDRGDSGYQSRSRQKTESEVTDHE